MIGLDVAVISDRLEGCCSFVDGAITGCVRVRRDIGHSWRGGRGSLAPTSTFSPEKGLFGLEQQQHKRHRTADDGILLLAR